MSQVPSPSRADPRAPEGTVPSSPARTPSPEAPEWVWFSAVLMVLLGLSWALLGLVALLDEQDLGQRANELFVVEGYAAWGWVHLLGGLLAVAAGAGILQGGHRWARLSGIGLAVACAVVNLGFLAASPAWSTVVIALSVVAVHALTVHGREIDER
ncbi:hypothetical protein ACI780_11875 [Geodermatophilus sp. SYSU D00814]